MEAVGLGPGANPTTASYNARAVELNNSNTLKSTTPRCKNLQRQRLKHLQRQRCKKFTKPKVAWCVLKTKILSSALKNALVYNNVCAVKIYNAMGSSLVRFENENIVFYFQ
jgi:hypothetical protein